MKIIPVILFLLIVFASGIRKPGKQIESTVKVFDNPESYSKINEAQQLLKNGDLIVRLNHDPISLFIKDFNSRDKKYSHAGLVFFENGQPYVYHIINGEENPGEKIKRETVTGFCNPNKNSAFGIFRYKIDSSEVEKLKSVIQKWYKKEVKFDLEFDLLTDQKMYCSEMISKAMARITHNRIKTGTTELTHVQAVFLSTYLQRPYKDFDKKELIAIDDLYKPDFCSTVKEFVYK